MDLTPIATAAEHLSEPVKVLIERISAGVSRAYEPLHARRMARATVDAKFIEKLGKHDVQELAAAYAEREVYRNARKQLNLKLVADKALPHLLGTPESKQVPPEEEWVEEFEEKAERAHSSSLQELWARILAGEIKESGSIPKRTLRYVSDLDQRTAVFFQKVVSCSVFGNARILIAYPGFFEKMQISIFDLKELASLGFIELPTFKQAVTHESGFLRFGKQAFQFMPAKTEHQNLDFYLFTRVGETLANVCEPIINDTYFSQLGVEMTKAGWSFQIVRQQA
jgi:hypothetical protein